MLRFYARLSIGIVVIACLIVGTIRLVGATIPVPDLESLQQFSCTPQPCWHRIHIGVTTVPEAASILRTDQTIQLWNYDPSVAYVCWRRNDHLETKSSGADGCYRNDLDTVVTYMDVSFLASNHLLRLGDLLPIMGQPLSASFCKDSNLAQIYAQNMNITLKVPSDSGLISPDLRVDEIYLHPVSKTPAKIHSFSEWRSFFTWANMIGDCGDA